MVRVTRMLQHVTCHKYQRQKRTRNWKLKYVNIRTSHRPNDTAVHASVHNSFLEWLPDMQFDFMSGFHILRLSFYYSEAVVGHSVLFGHVAIQSIWCSLLLPVLCRVCVCVCVCPSVRPSICLVVTTTGALEPFNGPFFQDYPGEPVPER